MAWQDAEASGLSPSLRAKIVGEVVEAAWGHLKARDADSALSFFMPDAVVAGDGWLYESFGSFAEDGREFYRTLSEVRVAEWIDPRVDVLTDRVAVFTSKVRWESTDTEGHRLELNGVWTAVWLLTPEGWRMVVRHESFANKSNS